MLWSPLKKVFQAMAGAEFSDLSTESEEDENMKGVQGHER